MRNALHCIMLIIVMVFWIGVLGMLIEMVNLDIDTA